MKLIRLRQVLEITALSRSTLYRLMNINQFPRSISLGGRPVAWVEAEIEDWLAERLAERDNAYQDIN